MRIPIEGLIKMLIWFNMIDTWYWPIIINYTLIYGYCIANALHRKCFSTSLLKLFIANAFHRKCFSSSLLKLDFRQSVRIHFLFWIPLTVWPPKSNLVTTVQIVLQTSESNKCLEKESGNCYLHTPQDIVD